MITLNNHVSLLFVVFPWQNHHLGSIQLSTFTHAAEIITPLGVANNLLEQDSLAYLVWVALIFLAFIFQNWGLSVGRSIQRRLFSFSFFLSFPSFFLSFLVFFFLSEVYTKCGTWTHKPEIKSLMLYQLGHSGTPGEDFLERERRHLFIVHWSPAVNHSACVTAMDYTLKNWEDLLLWLPERKGEDIWDGVMAKRYTNVYR